MGRISGKHVTVQYFEAANSGASLPLLGMKRWGPREREFSMVRTTVGKRDAKGAE